MYCLKKMNAEQIKVLERKAYEIRRLSLLQTLTGCAGHPGGTMSMADILSVLYFQDMNITPENINDESRDVFVLSKAHAAPALYAALALKGIIPEEQLTKYCCFGGVEGHTDALETPGVEMSGGSLGLGLSFSVGVAEAMKQKKQYNRRCVCVVGDGEIAEGTNWEAISVAQQRMLDNLILFVDYNKVQAKAFLSEEISFENMADKFRSFNWSVQEIDGHDIEEIHRAYYNAKYVNVNGKPNVIIAHTVKGKGIERCEFNYKWHAADSLDKNINELLTELALNYGYEPELTDLKPVNSHDCVAKAYEEV